MELYETLDVIINSLNFFALIGLALYGFTVWKNQFRLSKKYEVAKKLLDTVNSLKSEHEIIRSPFISPLVLDNIEIDITSGHTRMSTYNYLKHYFHFFESRWDNICELASKLRNLKFETNIILGLDITDTSDAFSEISSDIFKAVIYLNNNIQDNTEQEFNRLMDEEETINCLKIISQRFFEIFQSTDEEEDKISIRLDDCLRNIQEATAQYLILKE